MKSRREGGIARKRFYLIKLKDKLTDGRATFYCRFRDNEGILLPWKSTGHATRTAAENWTLSEIRKRDEARP